MWILMISCFKKIKISRGAKDRAELSELIQSESSQADLIQVGIM